VLSLNNPYQEYVLCPELAIEIAKPHWMDIWVGKWECRPYLPHDPRAFEQWKFACIVFELLHGYAPWEPPEYYDLIGELYDFHKNMGYKNDDGVDIGEAGLEIVLERRDAIINTEVRIDEGMSQDCVDALRAMLARDPAKRPDPTHLEELASFPWFQGQWVDHGPFQRPTPSSEWYDAASS
jgi:serine/threonine protein kinase